MIISGMQRCSTIDFPGILACVLFMRGCDMSCFYCHNRALLEKSGPVLAMQDVRMFLKKRMGLLDGAVISGGEPTLQPGLADFLRELKQMGYQTKLDTNGMHVQTLCKLIESSLLDYVAVDFKAPQEDYAWVCGREEGYTHARSALIALRGYAIPFEARCTLYPGLSADKLLALLHDLPPLPRFRLNLFRMPEEYRMQDTLLLRRAALTATELDALLPRMREAQPGIVW